MGWDKRKYRNALNELCENLRSLRSITPWWFTRYLGSEDCDPVERAWEACQDPQIMGSFLSLVGCPILDLPERQQVVPTENGYELQLSSGFVVVFPTLPDAFRHFYNPPSIEHLLTATGCYGDA